MESGIEYTKNNKQLETKGIADAGMLSANSWRNSVHPAASVVGNGQVPSVPFFGLKM